MKNYKYRYLSLNFIRINIFNSVNYHCMQIIQMVTKNADLYKYNFNIYDNTRML